MNKKNTKHDRENLGFIGGTIEEKSTHESLVETVVTVKGPALSGLLFIYDMLHMVT